MIELVVEEHEQQENAFLRHYLELVRSRALKRKDGSYSTNGLIAVENSIKHLSRLGLVEMIDEKSFTLHPEKLDQFTLVVTRTIRT